jgi:hypothetical protein
MLSINRSQLFAYLDFSRSLKKNNDRYNSKTINNFKQNIINVIYVSIGHIVTLQKLSSLEMVGVHFYNTTC